MSPCPSARDQIISDRHHSYGRVSGYLISAREFEELQRLRAFERRAHRINDLPAEIADAIEGSKMILAPVPHWVAHLCLPTTSATSRP
jgi:hypothetical protein